MDMPLSERRQIENEMVFRRANEKVGDGLESLDAVHIQENELDLVWDDSIPLKFKCECSDENCDQRISVKLSTYKKIHENRRAFIIKPGHQVEEIEKVILRKKSYHVVQKNHSVVKADDALNTTQVHNA